MPEIEIDSDNEELTIVLAQEDRYGSSTRLNFDEHTREIYVDGGIDISFGDWFLKIHRHLVGNGEAKDPITVWLNTSGGDVQCMFDFCDIVRASTVPITIIGHGNVCSAGVLMLACGHVRKITRHCVMMIHQYAADGEGDGLRYAEAKERRKWEDWTHESMIHRMVEYSTVEEKDLKYWTRIFDKKAEHWLLGGQEIVDEGLADEVLPY